jgi:hypothetical protein
MPDEDERAIARVVENWFTAWQRGDAELAVRDYADDADWTNVFGVRCKSRAELRATLTGIFSQPSVMAGSDTIVGHETRFLGGYGSLQDGDRAPGTTDVLGATSACDGRPISASSSASGGVEDREPSDLGRARLRL